MSDSHKWEDQEIALERLEAAALWGSENPRRAQVPVDWHDLRIMLDALKECREHTALTRREALEEAAKIATPYHATPDQPDGCLILCSSCRKTRMIRDAIRALAGKEAPNG